MMKPKQSGFTMIEVLTSLFVLAVGIVGAAAMQLTALRTAQQSAFQTAAVQLATEAADKMRTSIRFGMKTGFVNPFLDLVFASATDAVPAPEISCFASDCSNDDLARFELYEWKNRVKNVLPGGRVRICRDTAPWNNVAASLTWACTLSPDGAAGTPVVIKIGWDGKEPNRYGSVKSQSEKNSPPAVAITLASHKE
jgi:type IV pilus assembly protein PilV